jgi:hypothetical protein
MPRFVWPVSALVLISSVAQAQTWAVSSRSTGSSISDADVRTFQRLLADELTTRGKQASPVMPACGDWSCLKDAAAEVGATVAVDSEFLPLGRKVLVRAEARELATGRVLGNARMTAAEVEELETIAARLATALATGQPIEETAEVGQAVKAEDDLGRLRGGRHGLALWALGVAPIRQSYADGSPGVGVHIAYWFETRHFALEPRIGFHMDGNGGVSRFYEMPIELAAYWVPLTGDVSPFVGLGAGVRSVWERREEDVTVGSTLVTTSRAELNDSAWGFGTTVRAGVILFRTYRLRLLLSAEYSAAFLSLNDRRNPQAFRFGAGILF